MTSRFKALADTNILNLQGHNRLLDDLLDEPNHQENVLRFTNKGVFASTHLIEVEPEINCENIKVLNITLHSGEKFTLLEGSKVLASDNRWVAVNEKKVGDGIKALTYNPAHRHPQLTPKVIASVTSEIISFAPVVSFSMVSSENYLISAQENANIHVLIPVTPQN